MKNVLLLGHNGMVGSAISRKLNGEHHYLDRKHNLERQSVVESVFDKLKPEVVILAAAKVGGIHANNTYRAEFIYRNLEIQNNVIHSCYLYNVKKLLFLGSSCIYPKNCTQPMKEEMILTSSLEYTNEPYAIAKIAGIKMCESYFKQYGCNFISVMPTNLYGKNDHYDPNNSHVIPALILKIHQAKIKDIPEVEIWGSGNAEREFMYVDDMAEACLHILENVQAPDIYDNGISHINIGTGEDVKISQLAELIKKVIGYNGQLVYNTDKPDGHPKKLLDVSRLNTLGYKHKFTLEKGLIETYADFLKKN